MIHNDTIDTILKRRTIRRYKPDPIPTEALETILQCARNAPSAMDSQPWKFIVVTDKATRDRLADKTMVLGKNFMEGIKDKVPERYEIIRQRFATLPDPVFYGAPVVVLIASNGGPFSENAVALAAENLMLAACSLGLGSCCIGMATGLDQDPEVREMCGLSPEQHIVLPMVLGVPDEQPSPSPRKSETLWI